MIGFLSGIVKDYKRNTLLLNVNGVGYKILVSDPDIQIGKPLDVYVHTHVREDELSLFGFKSSSDLEMFENLLTVSGIGPKSALSIITAGGGEIIKKALLDSNLSFFTSISGIGKKSAQRIIIELRPKITSAQTNLDSLQGNPVLADALKDLGFKNQEIISVITQINPSDDLTIQIKQALKLLRI